MELYQQVKSVIQSHTCPVHNLHPIINISPTILDINCCCELFKNQCIDEIQQLLKDSANIKKVIASKKGAQDI